MKESLERLESRHEALIAALDRNDVAAIERASRDLDESLAAFRGLESWTVQPELKLAAERIARLAEAAAMRVNVLNDQAKRRSEGLAAMRGQPAIGTYTR